MYNIIKLAGLILCINILSACATTRAAEPTRVSAPTVASTATPGTLPEMSSSNTVASAVAYPRKTGQPYVIKGVTYYPLQDVSQDYTEVGIASWYGKDFHGKKTANGEIYDMHDMTAAHKTLPMPTFVKVTHLDNGREIIVRVNDRGPFSKGRIIDLSYAAAQELGMVDSGTARVRITVMSESVDHLRTENIDIDLDRGSFAIQLGAFADKSNAERLAARYSSAAVVPVQVDGRTLYRVQVRGYRSKHEATVALRSFEREFSGAFVLGE